LEEGRVVGRFVIRIGTQNWAKASVWGKKRFCI
jgi:hypothetical protein